MKGIPMKTWTLAILLVPALAAAEGSGGSGGLGPGEHEAVPYEETEYWLYVPDDYTDDVKMPLVVFLHGDEGDPRAAFVSIMPQYWRANPTAILIAPRAPFGDIDGDGSPDGSWWRDNERHDVWVTALVDYILGHYDIDLDRITIGGWSGGATFSAYHALGQQDRYAAVHFISGSNWWGIDDAPPDCPITCRWTEGTDDFLYDGARELYDMMGADGHGHDLEWNELPGKGHQLTNMQEYGDAYDWLASQVHGCATGGDADSDTDTDADTDSDADSDADADTDSDGDLDGGGNDDFKPSSGCFCTAGAGGSPGAAAFGLVAIGAAAFLRRRPK